ncbi:MAG TPA: AAA family ATPase [Firmicutes bacterium]|nr:AAA family ATPase [Bacillota bacterium]
MATVLEGVVERVTYHDPESLFTVVRLRACQGPAATGANAVVVGRFVALNPGDKLRLWGAWESHPQYGRQFHAEEYQIFAPETLKGIEAYLASGRLPGVGPATARRLVRAFGLDTLRVLAEEPERVKEVEGIGARRAQAIIRAFQVERALQQVMVFLQGHGISPAYAWRIFRRYGPRAVAIVRENPYRLARDVPGIGFQIADRIARGLGFASHAPERLAAGLFYALEQASESGHLFLPRSLLLRQTARLLRLEGEEGRDPSNGPAGTVAGTGDGEGRGGGDGEGEGNGDGEDLDLRRLASVLDQVIREGELIAEEYGAEVAVYLPRWWRRECEAAERLRHLVDRPRTLSLFSHAEAAAAIARWEAREGISLSPEQREAVEKGLQESCVVITGGPGTGKTTLIRCLVSLWHEAEERFALAAPTGRAARRLAEATGWPARTIHRLLEFGRIDTEPGLPEDTGAGEGEAFEPGGVRERFGFRRNEDRPLETDVVVVDEVSMLDLSLAVSLLRALPERGRLVLVGDADQLPSVGPGQFLADLIASGRVPVVRLSRIYRQAEQSGIVTNAHRINRGLMPVWGFRDFFLVEETDADAVAELVVDYATRRLPAALGLTGEQAVEAIQVLAPMRKGKVGVESLNARLQEALNPAASGKPALVRGGYSFRPGDKVMQIRNDYRQTWVRPENGAEPAPGARELSELLAVLKALARQQAAEEAPDEGDMEIDNEVDVGDVKAGLDAEHGSIYPGNVDSGKTGAGGGAGKREQGHTATRVERGEGVFNGELGRIVAVDPARSEVAVLFDDGRLALYRDEQLDEIVPAYATTVHKSQGNEFAAVVFPVTFIAPSLMSRHLLYTAITRAKRVCVLIGEKRALAVYVRRGEQERRFTLLARRLADSGR